MDPNMPISPGGPYRTNENIPSTPGVLPGGGAIDWAGFFSGQTAIRNTSGLGQPTKMTGLSGQEITPLDYIMAHQFEFGCALIGISVGYMARKDPEVLRIISDGMSGFLSGIGDIIKGFGEVVPL